LTPVNPSFDSAKEISVKADESPYAFYPKNKGSLAQQQQQEIA
jgi:hypothetical protein